MDAVFLRKHVGECLITCLAEVAEKRPLDPIEYIGQWLHNYIKDKEYLKRINEENKLLEVEETENSLAEKRKVEMKQEASELAKIDAESKQVEEKTVLKDTDSGSKLPTVMEV